MKVNRAHKIRLYPNNVQKTYFKKACGTSRFVYNWGLSLWKVQYELGKKPSAFGLKKEFNTIKNKNFPWISEVTKCASEQAFNNLGTSFKNFFTKKSKYPSYKKKGNRDSFYISNDKFLIKGDKIRIPKLGFVRMREELRFVGKIMSATVSRVADQWYVAISVETEVTSSVFENQEAVGVDLGVKALATLSTGEVVIGPKPHKQLLARLRLLNKSVARKKKGSSNRRKAVLNLSKLHSRIACIRNDTIHKLTTRLSQDFAIIGIEDLNVRGMSKNHCLSRAILDMGWGEFRRQLEYKTGASSSQLVVADRFFPSSKMCSTCGDVLPKLKLSIRTWICSCGEVHDRDINAAINLKKYAVGSTVKACGDGSSGLGKISLSETTVCEAGIKFQSE